MAWRSMTEEEYSNEVLRVVDAFAFAWPRRQNLFEDFPHVRSLIKEEYYKQGIAPNNAGFQIGAMILVVHITQGTDSDERAVVAKEFRELSDQDYAIIREVREADRGKESRTISFPGGIRMLTFMIASSMAFARDAFERGEIGPVTFQAIETEVSKALNGIGDTPESG